MATAEEEIRRRLLDVAPEPNESLPFHGRVRLARRKKPDSIYIIVAEVNNQFCFFLFNFVRFNNIGSSSCYCFWFALCNILSF